MKRSLRKISKEEKDKRQKKAQERYQNLTEEESKRVDRNISEGKKKKLPEHRRNHYLISKK